MVIKNHQFEFLTITTHPEDFHASYEIEDCKFEGDGVLLTVKSEGSYFWRSLFVAPPPVNIRNCFFSQTPCL